MEVFVSMSRKALFLEQQKAHTLLKPLQATIQSRLLQETDNRLVSPGVIRAVIFDLSHLLLRHRIWHSAPLLAELAIDFLNSEYLLPHHTCTMTVESCLDLIHRHTIAEGDWDAERFDQEFLEHLFISSLIAKDDQALATDIGFGRNVIELLHTAVAMSSNPSHDAIFQFAPELATRLHLIIQGIFQEASTTPWILDIYKLKNHLERDPFIRKNNLERANLERFINILHAAGAQGSTLPAMETIMQATPTPQELSLLERNELLFAEPQRKPLPHLYRLSSKGFELTSQRFAHAAFSANQSEMPALASLPAAYQAALVQLAWEKDAMATEQWVLRQAEALTPEALKPVIDACQKNQDEQTLLELFERLLHNQAHAWVRAEICRALPVSHLLQRSQALLESLAQNDLSPMVRSAARAGLKRKTPTKSRELPG